MKVAVYGICKNESQFVERFMACIKDEADLIVITDTGSTDDTVKKLRDLGAIVYEDQIVPWRFDHARNISLDHVPDDVDICVCIDLDEVLTPGWRKIVEDAYLQSPETTRLRYHYVWNTLPDGSPGLTYWYEKIHRRHGYRWAKPVHEVLETVGIEEVQKYVEGFTLFHFPDNTKSRGSYLPLLEIGCAEDPEDDRNSHYLGREYMFYKQYDKAITELKRHLSLSKAKWDAERSASMKYISRCYAALDNQSEAISWGLRSVAECPSLREPWYELGKLFYKYNDWSGAYFAMTHALSITEKSLSYITEPEAWSGYPHDYASIAASNLGMHEAAFKHCHEALKLNPTDERLSKNIVYLSSKLNVNQQT